MFAGGIPLCLRRKISVITSPSLLTYFTIKIILGKQDYWFYALNIYKAEDGPAEAFLAI